MMRLMHDAKPAGQQTLSGEDELVAGDHVVKRQHAGEQARQQQDVHHIPADPAERVVRGVEQHVGLAIERSLRNLGDLVWTDRHDERPAGHRIEGADDQDGRIRRAGDRPLWIACLVTEYRGGLETDEPGEGEQHGDSETAVGEHLRPEGVQGEA